MKNQNKFLALGAILAVMLGGCIAEEPPRQEAWSAADLNVQTASSGAEGSEIARFHPVAARGPTTPDLPLSQCEWVNTDTAEDHIPEALRSLTTTAKSISVGVFIVEYAAYPLPYPQGSPWSHWGKGRVASNGKVYSTVGDHGSQGGGRGSESDGNSLLYEYDPETRVLRAVGDAITAFGRHKPGDNGYGKIHGQIDEGPCGMLYLHTYWGSNRRVTYTETYRGDILLRYNPWTKHLESLGITMPGRGTPSTNMWEAGGLLYGEANVPAKDNTRFWVWDTQAQTLKYQESPGSNRGNRNIAVDLEGRAYFNDGNNGLRRYDPTTNEVEQLGVRFDRGGTDEFLRASTERTKDGTITLVTEGNTDARGARKPRYSEFYHFDPGSNELRWIAHDDRYVADVEADPTGKVLYYTPGAHEAANDFAVVELDRTTGERRTLISLGRAIGEAGGPQPGGSFSINISPDGKTLFFTSNSTLRGPGLPMIVVVHIPPSEMP